MSEDMSMRLDGSLPQAAPQGLGEQVDAISPIEASAGTGILSQGRSILSSVVKYAGDKLIAASERWASPVAAATIALGAGGAALKPLVEASAAQAAGADPKGALIAAKAPKVSFIGQQEGILFNTEYTYTASITSNKSYKHALITLEVPASTTPREVKFAHLTAHRPLRETFREDFLSTTHMDEGIDLGVQVIPPHQGYRTLFHKVYSIAAEPGQPPPPTTTPPPPPYFGS